MRYIFPILLVCLIVFVVASDAAKPLKKQKQKAKQTRTRVQKTKSNSKKAPNRCKTCGGGQTQGSDSELTGKFDLKN
jgi:hypothetical protein